MYPAIFQILTSSETGIFALAYFQLHLGRSHRLLNAVNRAWKHVNMRIPGILADFNFVGYGHLHVYVLPGASRVITSLLEVSQNVVGSM